MKNNQNDYLSIIKAYRNYVLLSLVAIGIILVRILDIEALTNFVEFINLISAVLMVMFLIVAPIKWIKLSRKYNNLMKEENEKTQ